MELFQVNELVYRSDPVRQEAVFCIKMTGKGKCKYCSSEMHSVKINTSRSFLSRCNVVAALEILAQQIKTKGVYIKGETNSE